MSLKNLKGEIMTKDEKQWVLDENKRFVILCDLQLGKVLINKTNGIVYLKDNKQVKIGMGKSRKGRDYEFSHPHYWRVATGFETFRVKLGFYRFWKVRF
jgi:hypothetical protein